MRPVLEHEAIKPLIGARVLNRKEELLSGALADELRALLEARGVLVFPGIGFDDAEQVAFTRTLGAYATDRADGGVTPIALDPDLAESTDYIRSSFFWHFDGYMNPVPVFASVLSPRLLPDSGGNTEFANTYAAWDALPEAERAGLEGLRVVHALAAAQRAVEPEPSHERFREWLRVPRATLPLVWTHRSGRKSLVIGNTAAGVVGMDPMDSLELLVRLRDWATQERFTYSHAWRPGDAVIWDNTGTLHRATPWHPPHQRLMHRTKLAGEEPFA